MALYFKTVGQGPPIVLLHGFGIQSDIWGFVIADLSRTHTVTCIDLPGYGRSDPLMDYSLDAVVSAVLSVAPPKATWVGWSMGGLIAMAIAITHPSCVHKLICVGSTPKFIRTDEWPGMTAHVLRNFTEQLSENYEQTLMRFIALQFHGLPINKEMVRWLRTHLFAHGRPTLQTLHGGLTLLESVDLRNQLQTITCPMLTILGRCDALVPHTTGEALLALNNTAEIALIPKAGHALFLSHKHEFLDQIRRFTHEQPTSATVKA